MSDDTTTTRATDRWPGVEAAAHARRRIGNRRRVDELSAMGLEDFAVEDRRRLVELARDLAPRQEGGHDDHW